MKKLRILILLFTILSPSLLYANDQNVRAKNLYRQIRCSTCAGQSIDESNTEPAELMKKYIVEQISLGKSDGEILNSIRDKYGDFLVMSPPFRAQTIMLWGIPLAFIAISIRILLRRTRVKS